MIKPGDKYQFEDGNFIEIIQIKNGEFDGELTQLVTYHIGGNRSIPRKLVMNMYQFVSNFGHLFEDKEA